MNRCERSTEYLRQKMVDEQLLRRDIKDGKVLDAFRAVPRHSFVDLPMRKNAYSDFPLSIGEGQTISQPYIVALMVQLLDIKKNDKILEIGTGSGYETAILAELGGTVFSLERMKSLAVKARDLLKSLGYGNIEIKTCDGTLGYEAHAPFDKIVVTASSPNVPKPLLDQLSACGKMVIPIGSRFSQTLVLIEKPNKGRVSEKDVCGCVFVPLVGRHGWSNETQTRHDGSVG
ncbi:protein-L-isoaspartate(D-aspartate) O-methyltransferase [Candidatus Omnitrophota bacterium]